MQEYFYFTTKKLRKKQKTKNKKQNKTKKTPDAFELVGLFTLNRQSSKFNKNNVRLFRDNGLAVLENINDHHADKIGIATTI